METTLEMKPLKGRTYTGFKSLEEVYNCLQNLKEEFPTLPYTVNIVDAGYISMISIWAEHEKAQMPYYISSVPQEITTTPLYLQLYFPTKAMVQIPIEKDRYFYPSAIIY